MSLKQFLAAWQTTGNLEAGYVCDENDSGGETCWGITIAVARAHGYTGPMKDLPKDVAANIAKQAYWDVLCLDDIALYSITIANKIFDMSILCGQPTAAMFFQRALNVFNYGLDGNPIFAAVQEDFRLGKMSIYALSQLAKARPKDWETVLLRALNAQQGSHLIDITRAEPKNMKFTFGWFLKRIG